MTKAPPSPLSSPRGRAPPRPHLPGTGAWSGLGAAVSAAIFGEPPAPRRDRETERGRDPKHARNEARDGPKEAAGEGNRPKGARQRARDTERRERGRERASERASELGVSKAARRSRQRGRGRTDARAGRGAAGPAAPAAAHLPRPGSSRRRGSPPLAHSPGHGPRPPSPSPPPPPAGRAGSCGAPARPAPQLSARRLRAPGGRAARAAPAPPPGPRLRPPPGAHRSARDWTQSPGSDAVPVQKPAWRPRTPNRLPLAPSFGQPGSDLRRRAGEGCETVEEPPGLPRARAPRSTLRKLVFLRSAPRAGYIVLLRWTGEVAAGLPSPPDSGRGQSPASRRGRLEAAKERGSEGRGSLPFAPPQWPCPCAPKPKAPLGVGEGQRGPDSFRAGPR